MEKIFYQWAGIGILSLVGWGVDVMPGNTSWIPSVIIWGIAFIWLVVTIFFIWKRKRTPVSIKSEAILSNLQIQLCDSSGNILDEPPKAEYWEWHTGSICYEIHGYFKVSNHTDSERTLEKAELVLVVNDEEVSKRWGMGEFPKGQRIRSWDTTESIHFSGQPFVDKIKLEKLVGHDFEKAEVLLVVTATGIIGKHKFKSHNRGR